MHPGRKLAYISILFCLPFISFAQTGTGVLLARLAAAKSDSEKIEAYKSLIVRYSASNPDSAAWYAGQGIEYAHKHNYPVGVGKILAQEAVLDENQGRIGLGATRTDSALAIYRQLHYLKGIAEMIHNQGTIEANKGNYDVAVKDFIAALKVYDSVDDKQGLMLTYMNLGNLYVQQQDTANARKYLELAEKISKTIPLSEATLFLYNTIGVMHAEAGQRETAETIFRNNVEMSNKPEFISAHIEALLYLGEFYSDNGEIKKALQCFDEGEETARNYHQPEMEANMIMDIARLEEKTDPAAAIEALNKAKALCENLQIKAFLLAIYTELAKVYKEQGNYKEALAATEEKQKINDSIFSMNKQKEIASLTSSYELEKSKLKVSELQRLSALNARERDIFIGIAVLFVIMLGILLFYFRKTTMLNKQLLAHEEELKELNSMKDKLFSVIGHDLRGPIARIPTILELYESEDTTEEEKKFLFDSLKEHTKISLETFDKLLYWGQSLVKGIRLHQVKMSPKTYIQESIALRKMRIAEKNITVIDATPEDLYVFADPALFDFIIRNLMANALKYTYRNGIIQISADTKAKPGFTVFSVKDNGVGMSKEVLARIFKSLRTTEGTESEKGHGIGLMLCREFAVLNGGDIWAESEPGKGSAFYFSVKNVA